jgi:hypothetical protein
MPPSSDEPASPYNRTKIFFNMHAAGNEARKIF